MSTASTEENVLSGKGSAEASPCTASTSATVLPSSPLFCAVSFTTRSRLYSRLVTRPALFLSSCVAAPAPAPISRMCSPSSVPSSSQGSNRRRVTPRQNEEEQNQFSKRFIDFATAGAGQFIIAGGRVSSAGKMQIDRHCTRKDFRAAGKVR